MYCEADDLTDPTTAARTLAPTSTARDRGSVSATAALSMIAPGTCPREGDASPASALVRSFAQDDADLERYRCDGDGTGDEVTIGEREQWRSDHAHPNAECSPHCGSEEAAASGPNLTSGRPNFCIALLVDSARLSTSAAASD